MYAVVIPPLEEFNVDPISHLGSDPNFSAEIVKRYGLRGVYCGTSGKGTTSTTLIGC